MGAISDLFATQTPTPYAVPIANGSGLLDDWVSGSGGFVNPMTSPEDLIVGGVAGAPMRLPVGYVGQVLTVGSGGYLDWEAGGLSNPMTHAEDLIVGGVSGIPTRLAVGYVGQVLTVGSGGYLDWEAPTGGFTNPMTSAEDLIVGGVAGAPTRLAKGYVGQVLTVGSGGYLDWETPTGGGSGTVNSGTATNFAYYAATGTAVSGTGTWAVSATGRLTMTPTAITSGVTSALTVTMPADTGLTASTESKGINIVGSTRTWADGTITSQREYFFGAPTYNKTTTAVTITNAATLFIENAPSGGTGVTLTNPFALWLGGGKIGIGASGSIATFYNPGNTGGLALVASGTNQNVLFVPSGTGEAIVCSSTTVPTTLLTTAIFASYGTTQANTGIAAVCYTATAGVSGELYLGHARGTFSSPTALSSGDTLGRVCFIGFSNALTLTPAIMRGQTTEAWGATAAGCAIIFGTTANTTTTRQDVVKIDQNGALSALINIASSSTTTGSIISAGGLGVAGAVFTGAAITTGTPSGGTAGAWKFGILVTAAVVPDTTRYIQLDVGGTLYKVIIST